MDKIGSLFDYIKENSALILNPGESRLRQDAAKYSIPNELGVMAFVSKIKARSPDRTLEGTDVIDDKLLEGIKAQCEKKKFYLIDKAIGSSGSFRLKSELLISVDYPHLALMFLLNYFPPPEDRPADIKIIDLPEWPKLSIFVDPSNFTTLILGSDYYGELKMSALRLAMHYAREKLNMLGLHAGGKIYRYTRSGKMIERGALIFGLSGTGKSTLVISKEGEGGLDITVRQDDIMILQQSGMIYGTEMNFYPKTDSINSLPDMLSGIKHGDAILENVMIKDNRADFSDFTISSNGRAIAIKKNMNVADDLNDIRSINFLFFLTRRNDMPVASKLTNAEQAAAYFLLGESTQTSAATQDDKQVNKPVRVIGFDPFILKPKWKNVLLIYQFMKTNDQVNAYLLNTGYLGQKKIPPAVTLDAIYKIVKDEARWHYDDATKLLRMNYEGYDPIEIFGADHYEKMMDELRKERINYMHENYKELEFLATYI